MVSFRSAARESQQQAIPAFLSIDVEPDGFQLTRGESPVWAGYNALFEFAERLRSDLSERSGTAPTFGWYFRTDPQIADVYGQADHALTAHTGRMAWLESKGDYFGVHAHSVRWCEHRHLWVHDFADAAWIEHCTRFSLEAFARCTGSPAIRFRSGSGFLSNEIVKTIDQCGVRVDLSLEPIIHGSIIKSTIDTSPLVGAFTDCRTAPCIPFHPAHQDFRVSAGRQGRSLVMVPLSTRLVPAGKPLWWRATRKLTRGSSGSWPEVQMFHPSIDWPSEKFWDLVVRQLQSMRRPYLSLAIRTDPVDSNAATRVRRLFEALPEHPLAQRLRFVDPLDAAPGLV